MYSVMVFLQTLHINIHTCVRVCRFINLEISLGGVSVLWTLSLREGDTKEAVLLMNNLHLFICIYHYSNEPPMKQNRSHTQTRMS